MTMASSLKTPEPFSFGASDLAAQWGVWRRQFEWNLIATRSGFNVDEEREEVGGSPLFSFRSRGLEDFVGFVGCA